MRQTVSSVAPTIRVLSKRARLLRSLLSPYFTVHRSSATTWPRPAQSSPPCASERRPIPKFARQSVRFSPASMTFLTGRRFEDYLTQSSASESRSHSESRAHVDVGGLRHELPRFRPYRWVRFSLADKYRPGY